MCWAFFGCCNDQVTIKAFDNTAPFALNWQKVKPAGTSTQLEFSSLDWFGEIATIGSRSPNNAGNTTFEGAIRSRAVLSGATITESTSTPKVAPGSGLRTIFAEDAVEGDAWVHSSGTAAVDASYFSASGAASAITQNVELNISIVNMFLQSGSDVIVAHSATTPFLETYDNTGASIDSLNASALSVSSGSVVGTPRAIRQHATDPILVYGSDSAGERLWLLDTGLNEIGANNPTMPAGGDWQVTDSIYHRPSTPDGNYAFLKVATVLSRYVVCVDLTTLAFAWTTSTGLEQNILAADNTHVYTNNNSGGGVLRAYRVSDGVLAWTSSSTSGSHVRVTSAGICQFGVSGVFILDPATGSTIDTIDNDDVYEVYEAGSQLICAGQLRDPS